MRIDVNQIVTLGNKEKYLVISHVNHQLVDYYYIAEVEENGRDIKDNYKIMKLTENDDKLFLDEVVGETNLKTVLPLFVNDIVK